MNIAHPEPSSSAPSSPLIIRGADRPDLLRQETLADLLQHTASRNPDTIALIDGEQSLSYRDLNTQADQVAHHLLLAGVRPGDLVGLWLPRGMALLVMQAGIAKAGAGWLPFDADTPIERIAVCLEDAQAKLLVAAAAWRDAVATLSIPSLDEHQLSQPVHGELQRPIERLPSAPAYVIYTSGSTGKPKGILIDQQRICHFLRSENALLGVRHGDRVYQGFSVAFDMSFEEIWISYLVGATLWIAPKSLATNPEALPDALTQAGITVLHAVPTLLALFPQDVPSLRLINLGGEMCPASLVDRWATTGREMFNTYGPTEATVSASLARLRAGEPVTIGTPLPNYGLLVVDEQQQPVPQGQTGELCIIGPGVAMGYLGRPDLTADKFLTNPWATTPHDQRLYRTGDLAYIDEHGQVMCQGRVDDQVKIRGFRVELGEIEAILCRQPGVGTAAVVLRQGEGVDQLVAFWVAEGDTPPDTASLRQALRQSLPPYMVPGRFEQQPSLPRLTSGKIDRKALRALPLAAPAHTEDGDQPETPAETALFAALQALFPGQAIRRGADFFDDLGGHSLLAAKLASQLRTVPTYHSLTLNAIYQARTIQAIADAMTRCAGEQHLSAPPPRQATPPWRHWLCGLAQAASLPFLISVHMVHWLAPFFTYHFLTGEEGDSIVLAIGAALLVFLLGQISAFAASIAGRRLLGRVAPGRYPLWGITYFRWWLSDRLHDIAPRYLLSGSSLQAWYLRALGAQVGRDVVIGSVSVRVPSLLQIGDGVSLGAFVNLENARVERGELVIGPIHIGNEAYIGSYAVLEGHTVVGEGGRLEGLSSLADGQQMAAGTRFEGAPARKVGSVDPSTRRPRPALSTRRQCAEAVFYALGAMFTSALFFIPIFPTFILVDWLDGRWLAPSLPDHGPMSVALQYFVLAIPASALLVVCTALLSAAIRWIALPRLQPGTYPVHGGVYYRKWLANQIQESSLAVLHGVYATVYAPWWYRLLGAKVGKRAEISTALGVVPDMLTLGDETFIADSVMLGDEEIDGGWMTLKPTVVGHRSFVGNGAYVPDGTSLPENVLIGVQTKCPATAAMQSGDTWMGSPALRLPARECLAGFPDHLTYRPSWRRRLGRALVEAARIVLPLALTIGVGYLIVYTAMPAAERGEWGQFALQLARDGLLYGLGCFGFVFLLKWLLIGRYRPQAAPMWTPFVWLSEAVTNLYEAIAVPNFVNMLRGTPMIGPMLRLMGARIGKGVYLDTTDLTEFDCVHIGDDVEMNAWSGPQTHLFEDRIMKIGEVQIATGACVRARSTILYDAAVGQHVLLGPLTLVLKGERIPARSAWIGSPAQPHQI
ncbi:Pls/PosA family non-ribosomal peptide synthetase [Chitinivorax tropicus]|uniref:Pls/PosA family non-ribosomal peptide synthetase n=1 Tax=Chitinivorax tropicus TaxID=714531 RepID=UPI003CCD6F2E